MSTSGVCNDVAFCGDPLTALVCGAEQVVARLAGCVVYSSILPCCSLSCRTLTSWMYVFYPNVRFVVIGCPGGLTLWFIPSKNSLRCAFSARARRNSPDANPWSHSHVASPELDRWRLDQVYALVQTGPINSIDKDSSSCASVAQLVRASNCESLVRRFDSVWNPRTQIPMDLNYIDPQSRVLNYCWKQ